jgi:hypothetical protein
MLGAWRVAADGWGGEEETSVARRRRRRLGFGRMGDEWGKIPLSAYFVRGYWLHNLKLSETDVKKTIDVGITLWVPDIAIPGADHYGGAPAHGLDKLDLHVLST